MHSPSRAGGDCSDRLSDSRSMQSPHPPQHPPPRPLTPLRLSPPVARAAPPAVRRAANALWSAENCGTAARSCPRQRGRMTSPRWPGICPSGSRATSCPKKTLAQVLLAKKTPPCLSRRRGARHRLLTRAARLLWAGLVFVNIPGTLKEATTQEALQRGTVLAITWKGKPVNGDDVVDILEHYAKHSKLATVHLQSCYLGVGGGKHIARALKTVSTLFLESNSIRDEGVRTVATALAGTQPARAGGEERLGARLYFSCAHACSRVHTTCLVTLLSTYYLDTTGLVTLLSTCYLRHTCLVSSADMSHITTCPQM